MTDGTSSLRPITVESLLFRAQTFGAHTTAHHNEQRVPFVVNRTNQEQTMRSSSRGLLTNQSLVITSESLR